MYYTHTQILPEHQIKPIKPPTPCVSLIHYQCGTNDADSDPHRNWPKWKSSDTHT